MMIKPNITDHEKEQIEKLREAVKEHVSFTSEIVTFMFFEVEKISSKAPIVQNIEFSRARMPNTPQKVLNYLQNKRVMKRTK